MQVFKQDNGPRRNIENSNNGNTVILTVATGSPIGCKSTARTHFPPAEHVDLEQAWLLRGAFHRWAYGAGVYKGWYEEPNYETVLLFVLRMSVGAPEVLASSSQEAELSPAGAEREWGVTVWPKPW